MTTTTSPYNPLHYLYPTPDNLYESAAAREMIIDFAKAFLGNYWAHENQNQPLEMLPRSQVAEECFDAAEAMYLELARRCRRANANTAPRQ